MKNFLDSKILGKLLPVLIFLFAFAVRVYGINWDQNQHLHPDERFLTMTTDAMVWPESLAEYLSPSVSKLNPYNIGTMFYVYGTLPTTIVKYFSRFELFEVFQYNNIALTGRLISAIFDVGVTYLVFLIAKNVFNRKTALLAAFLYSISVLPIQLSHFFAVDTFLNFFLVLTFYFLIKMLNFTNFAPGCNLPPRRGSFHLGGGGVKLMYSILLGLSFGAALACKISALYFLPVIFLGFLIYTLKYRLPLYTIYHILYTSLAAYATFRILDPHVFIGNIFPPEISPQFIKNIKELQGMVVKDSLFPPAIQWQSITPILFPLQNIILWGLGLPLGFLSLVAIVYSTYQTIPVILTLSLSKGKNLFTLCHSDPEFIEGDESPYNRSFASAQDDNKKKSKKIQFNTRLKQLFHNFNNLTILRSTGQSYKRVKQSGNFLILFWVLFLFTYQAIQLTPSMRYFLPIYPFLAILSANFSITFLFPRFKKSYILYTTYYILICLWPISFLSIYSRPHSRVMASSWIYQNIPAGSKLSCDAWDDCLPLSVEGVGYSNKYQIVGMEPFVPDSPEKVAKFESQLKEIDYLVLTSNRAWGSLTKVPDKFPYMSKFYKELFSGNLNFEEVAEITSYPTIPILGISVPDDFSEEAFTVYDHPKVLIYKRK